MVRVLGRKQRQGCGRSRSLPASCRSCSFLLPRVFILRTRSSLPSLPSLPSHSSPTSSSTSIACNLSPAICAPPAVILHLTARPLCSQCLFIVTHSTRPQRAFHPGLGPLHSLPASPTARPILQFASVLATHPVGCQSCHRLSACSHSHYVGTDAYSSSLLADGHLLTQSALACFLSRVAGQTRPSFPSFWLSPLSPELILHLGSPCRPTCICLLHCRHPSPEAPYISETWMVRCLSFSHGQARVHSIGQMSSYGIRPACLVQMPI
jgi:hypothetical protein